MLVLAHRANYEGVNKLEENSLDACRLCLEHGWGIETDIRRTSNGSFYISHDAAEWDDGNHADRFCELWRQYPHSTIALNVKELGYEADLLEYLIRQNVVSQLFLFDMELLEPHPGQTARLFRQLDPKIRLAARVSDRNEPIEQALSVGPTDIIWVDEFDYLWVREADIHRLKSASKTIYAISPEIHGFTLNQMYQRWRQFYAWGVDGICTDYAAELAQLMADGSLRSNS